MTSPRLSSDFFQSPFGKFVSWHLQHGFALFPIHGIDASGTCTCRLGTACENTGKHPYTAHGFKDASRDPDPIARLFDGREDLNIGIATGKPSGIVVIDLDGEAGEASWQAMTSAHPSAPPYPGMVFVTGKGRHLLFRHPGATVKSRQRFKGYQGIDVRADGGYIVAPPSMHESGRKYRVLDETYRLGIPHAPSWLLALLMADAPRKEKPADYAATSGAVPEWGIDEVRAMLSVLDASMGYQEWIEIGMALHAGGFPLSVWDDWSRSGRQYKPNCCVVHWRSFKPGQGISMGTLVDKARSRGWKPPGPTNADREPVDVSGIMPFVEKARARWESARAAGADPETGEIAQVSHSGQFGFDPLELPGMIGDTVRWITHHAFFDQPELALLNTLAFAGACMGRRYASPMDTRTNLYLIGIAGTGQGKDFSRKMIQSLAAQTGLSDFIGGNAIRSGSGLAREMEGKASQIMMLDEFGMFLQALADPKAMPYLRETSKMLMELYSASNGSYNHGAYGDAKAKPIVLHQPNLCVYGTTTLASYVPALRKSAIESGDLNRFVVIPSTVDVTVKRTVPPVDYPPHLIEAWARLTLSGADALGAANAGGMAGPKRRVEWGIGVEDKIYEMRVEQLAKLKSNAASGALWARYAENCIKIAMVLSIARDAAEPVIGLTDLGYAEGIVRRSVEFMAELAAEHMAENEHEANSHEMLRFIRSHGAGGVGRSVLLRRFRKFKRKDMEELLNSLLEQGAIEVTQPEERTNSRPPVLYRAIQA